MVKKVILISLFNTILAYADCNDDPNNLISSSNCSFDSDVSQWGVIGAHDSFVHDPTEDFLSQGVGHGSALIDAEDQGSFFIQASHLCTGLSSTDAADKSGGVWLKVNSGTDVSCSINLVMYSSMACDAADQVGVCTTGPVPDIPIDNNWSQLSCNSVDSGPLTATPIAFFPQVFCTSNNDFTINLDNIYFGQQGLMPVELLNFSIE